MKAAPALDCRMELTLPPTPDGRPEVYDFFWDHTHALFHEFNAKEVNVKINLPVSTVRGKKTARTRDHELLLDSLVQKFTREKRFGSRTTHVQTPRARMLHVRIPTAHLESALSSYNILFDAGLAATTFVTPELVVDFTRASENKVRVFTTTKNQSRVKEFLAAHARAPLHLHTLTVGKPHPLQAKITPHTPASRGKGR